MTDPTGTGDDEVQALAAAERDAGIPDRQTAEAAAAAKLRQADAEDSEAHPS